MMNLFFLLKNTMTSQFSQRSLMQKKLERRLLQEEQKQRKYAAQLGKQGVKVQQIRRTLKQQEDQAKVSPPRHIRQRTPAPAALVNKHPEKSTQKPGNPENIAMKALAALDAWMRLRGYRPIDLFRMCDVNTSSTSMTEGDDMLDAEEFRGLFEKKLDVKISAEDVDDIIKYLDIDGNGEIDVQELGHALKRARRKVIPRDPWHLIAEKLTNDPYNQIRSMPTGAALRSVKRRQVKEILGHIDTHHTYNPSLLHLENLDAEENGDDEKEDQ
jgi:hypothetical protein